MQIIKKIIWNIKFKALYNCIYACCIIDNVYNFD